MLDEAVSLDKLFVACLVSVCAVNVLFDALVLCFACLFVTTDEGGSNVCFKNLTGECQLHVLPTIYCYFSPDYNGTTFQLP